MLFGLVAFVFARRCLTRPSIKYELLIGKRNSCELTSSNVVLLLGRQAKRQYRHDAHELTGDFNDAGICQIVLKRVPLSMLATAVNISIATSSSTCRGYSLYYRVPAGGGGMSSMGFSADQHWSKISSAPQQQAGRSCSFISTIDWSTTKQRGPLHEVEIKVELAGDRWMIEPTGFLVTQLCASSAPTPAPTLHPSPAPPSPAPTFSQLEPICKNTWCTFDPKDTYANTKIFSNAVEKFHCQKEIGFNRGNNVNCKCICDSNLDCSLGVRDSKFSHGCKGLYTSAKARHIRRKRTVIEHSVDSSRSSPSQSSSGSGDSISSRRMGKGKDRSIGIMSATSELLAKLTGDVRGSEEAVRIVHHMHPNP